MDLLHLGVLRNDLDISGIILFIIAVDGKCLGKLAVISIVFPLYICSLSYYCIRFFCTACLVACNVLEKHCCFNKLIWQQVSFNTIPSLCAFRKRVDECLH